MQYDKILQKLGEFGPYQKKNYFLLCIPVIFTSMHLLGFVYTGYLPAHRCRLPIDNASHQTYFLSKEILNLSIPWDANKKEWSSCEMHSFNPNDSMSPWSNISVKCDSWVYDESLPRSSFVMEWNLVCDKSWVQALVESCFMIGVLIADIFLGSVSDRWGRRKVFVGSVVLMMLSGVVMVFASEPISFCILRVVSGFFESGVFICGFVLGMEMVGISYRLYTGIFIEFFFAFGYFVNAFLGYFIHDWMYFQLAISVPMVVFIFYWWLIPESPRWLLAHGQKKEACILLSKAAEVNKVDISSCLTSLTTETLNKKDEGSALDLVRYPVLRSISLNMFYHWFVNSLVYYGLSLHTSHLGGNIYVTSVISGAVEIPAYAFCLLVLNYIGRKKSLSGTQLLAGAMLLLTLAVPQDQISARIALIMTGKLAIAASFAILFIYAAELFPTVVRNRGVALCSLSGRLGAVVASFVRLLDMYYKPLPEIIFGTLALVAGFLSLLFPETLNRRLMDTVKETENMNHPKSIDERVTKL